MNRIEIWIDKQENELFKSERCHCSLNVDFIESYFEVEVEENKDLKTCINTRVTSYYSYNSYRDIKAQIDTLNYKVFN